MTFIIKLWFVVSLLLFIELYFTRNMFQELLTDIYVARINASETLNNINTESIQIQDKQSLFEDICQSFSMQSKDDDIITHTSNENNVNIDIFEDTTYNLSIILGTRNDNYGGNLLERFTTTLRQYIMFPWYSKYGVRLEIIITQYNYIPSNLFIYQEPLFIKLMNEVNTTKSIENISIKFINVPNNNTTPSMHYLNSSIYCPMLEFVAKNIALRRSKSQWKLVTNQDDFFPTPLLKWIATSISNNELNKFGIYQSERASINKTDVSIFNNNDLSSLTVCRSYALDSKHKLLQAGGDFNLFHVSLLSHLGGGYLEINGHWHLDSEFLTRFIYAYQYKTYTLSMNRYCRPLHIEHKREYTNKYDLAIMNSKDNNYTSITCDPYKDIIEHLVIYRMQNNPENKRQKAKENKRKRRYKMKYVNGRRKVYLITPGPTMGPTKPMQRIPYRKRILQRLYPELAIGNETHFWNKALTIQKDNWGLKDTPFDVVKCTF